ncbi:MAG: helix-turn-helix domain-containing protein, partial [Micromonosporaceae bacterium]
MPPSETASGPPPTGTQAIDRAAKLLALVVQSEDPRTFSSLVEEMELAKSTCSRLLHALERNHLVRRDRDGAFRPGPLFTL